MKILIEESVLRQALETFTHCYAETDRRINERAKLLEELRKLANEATPRIGFTKCECGHPACHKWHANITGSNGGFEENDALFISAANTQTILVVCDLLEQMRDALILGYQSNFSNNALIAFNKLNENKS